MGGPYFFLGPVSSDFMAPSAPEWLLIIEAATLRKRKIKQGQLRKKRRA
jgi:hypothetical protein